MKIYSQINHENLGMQFRMEIIFEPSVYIILKIEGAEYKKFIFSYKLSMNYRWIEYCILPKDGSPVHWLHCR